MCIWQRTGNQLSPSLYSVFFAQCCDGCGCRVEFVKYSFVVCGTRGNKPGEGSSNS